MPLMTFVGSVLDLSICFGNFLNDIFSISLQFPIEGVRFVCAGSTGRSAQGDFFFLLPEGHTFFSPSCTVSFCCHIMPDRHFDFPFFSLCIKLFTDSSRDGDLCSSYTWLSFTFTFPFSSALSVLTTWRQR